MISFSVSEILPATPVRVRGIRAVKSPRRTAVRTASSCSASRVSPARGAVGGWRTFFGPARGLALGAFADWRFCGRPWAAERPLAVAVGLGMPTPSLASLNRGICFNLLVIADPAVTPVTEPLAGVTIYRRSSPHTLYVIGTASRPSRGGCVLLVPGPVHAVGSAPNPDTRGHADGRRAHGVRARARQHPLHRPAGGDPGGVSRRARRVRAGRHPLRLHPSPVRRDDRAGAGAGAGAQHPPAHRHRVGERGDRGRLHEGGRRRLPPQGKPLPHRSGHRGGARAPAPPGRAEAVRGRAPPVRGQPPGDLREQPPMLRAGGPGRHRSGLQPDGLRVAPQAPRPGAPGRRADHRVSPRHVGNPGRRPGRRGPPARVGDPRCRRRAPLVRDQRRAHRGRRGPGDRRLPQRGEHRRAEARGAYAPGQRGALPRPVRQRQRPGLHDRSGRLVPVREPGLARRHRVLGR